MQQSTASLNISKENLLKIHATGFKYCNDFEKNAFQGFDFPTLDSLRAAPKTKTALDIYQEEILHASLLTYNPQLDLIFKDEIVPKTVVELTGEPGSGKTQICFQLCIAVQLPKFVGGVGREAFYLGTNRNFSSSRIRELSGKFINQFNELNKKAEIKAPENFIFNEDSILDHIHYVNVRNITELFGAFKLMETHLEKNNVGLLVIDSISYPLRLVDSNERTEVVHNFFRRLQELSHKFNFATVLTNDLTTRTNQGEAYNTPSFGDTFYHFVNTRVWFSRLNSTVFSAKLMKGIMQVPREIQFSL